MSFTSAGFKNRRHASTMLHLIILDFYTRNSFSGDRRLYLDAIKWHWMSDKVALTHAKAIAKFILQSIYLRPNALIGFRFQSIVTELFHFDWKHLRQCETLNAHVHALKIFHCRTHLVTANRVACNFQFLVFVIETDGYRGRGLIHVVYYRCSRFPIC